MVAVNRIGQALTAQEVRDIARNKKLSKKGFTDEDAKQVNGYIKKSKGFYYYDWGKIKVNPSIKRTTSNLAYLDVVQYNNTSGNDAIISLTETYSTIKTPEPRKILGMDLNEWMGILLSGPIDAEVIGAKGGLKIATIASRSKAAIKVAVKSGKISPELGDELEILIIAKGVSSKPKTTKDAIRELTNNTSMTTEEKINAINIIKDGTLTNEESIGIANEAIGDIKRAKITKDIGEVKSLNERIEKLNNYKTTDKETDSILDDMISEARTERFNNSTGEIFVDDTVTLEEQYNKLLELKNNATEGENTDYIDSLLRDRLERIKTRDEQTNSRLAREAQEARTRIYEEEQVKIKQAKVKAEQDRIDQSKVKAESDKARQGTLLDAQLYEADLRKREREALARQKALEALGEGGTITDEAITGTTAGTGSIPQTETGTIDIDEEEVGDMDLEEEIQELDIDPRTGQPYTSKFLQDAIEGGKVEGPGVTGGTAGTGTIPGYNEGDPIDDDPYIDNDGLPEFVDDGLPEFVDDTQTENITAETYYNKSINRNTTYQNIDIVLERTVRLSNEVYSTTLFEKENYYIIPLEVPVLIHTINNTLYIAFRGTASYSNILSDLLLSTSFDRTSNYLYSNDYFHSILNPTCLDIQFHEGFTRLLSRIYGPIKLEIDKYIATVANIVLTGHSLGGALSAMFYYMYVNDLSPIRIPVRWCVTYGSPRFLFIDGYDQYTQKCPHVIRVYNSEDIVSYLPLEKDYFKNVTSGYIHVGQVLNVIGENAPNNINNLLTGMIKNNRTNITNLTKKKDDTFIFDLFEFLLSTNYLNMVLSGVIECVSTVSIDKEITGLEIESIVSKLETDMEFITDYAQKCILTKKYGVEETLLNDNINLKNIASNKSMSEIISGLISSYTGGVLSNSVITKEAHSKELYKKLIDNLVNIESQVHDDIFDIREEPKKMFYESLREDNLVYVQPTQHIVYGRVEGIDIEGVMLVEFEG